jgi:hypothetical protein
VITPLSRVAPRAEIALLCLSVLFLCVHTLPRAWRTLITDFPNYYLSARLAHEGYDTSRMYEWPWIEREKDHRAVDIRVIGLLPITPFSTLAVWPLIRLSPLAAKHIWILVNLTFLIPIGWMLRAMTGLSYRRIALVILLSFPLHRNLLFGQFYVLLLLLLVAACWSYLRGFRALAGALVAIAAVCKIFPLLLFVFFLQRRDWRALFSGSLTGLSAIALSVAVFGLNAHRTWLQEILPWVMRGEGLGTYAATASFCGVLHYLFLSEPQWNPHPWHYSPLCYAFLAPALQMLTLAPAVLLIRRDDGGKERILLEWSALVTAALTISTIPASYNFVLMVLPVCVLASRLFKRKQYGWLMALAAAYLGIGFPIAAPPNVQGLSLLLYVPRLPLMLAVLLGIYVMLWCDLREDSSSRDWTRYAWATAMIASVAFSVHSTLHVERAQRGEYAYRVPLQTQGFFNGEPQSTATGIRYSAFTVTGYRLIAQDRDGVRQDPYTDAEYDLLSFANGAGHTWAEQASASGSQIVDLQQRSHPVIDDARDPMLSEDQQSLAFIRDDRGRGRLMVRRAFQAVVANETSLTPSKLNVYEASFLSDKDYAFSATEGGGLPQIYLTDATHMNLPIAIPGTRYPALSPDGRWMAYSHLDQGVWNLWLRDQSDGTVRRIADVPCNQIQPSWESDSKTLLYGTDCGRSVWFTAVSRRKVVP